MSIVAGFCVYLWKRPVMQYTDRDIGVSGVSPGVSAGVTPGVFPGGCGGCVRTGMLSERPRQRSLMVLKIGLLKQIRQMRLKQL